MTNEEINSIVIQIIANAGDSKSFSMEAITNAEDGQLELAIENLKSSQKQLTLAHEVHTKLLVKEAKNPGLMPITLMVIHASNHLSAAELTFDLAQRFINVYQINRRKEVQHG